MTGPHPEFKAFENTNEVQEWLGTLPREKTRRTYVSSLFRYWRDFLSKTHPTLSDWIHTVRRAQRSEDNVVRKTWALDVQRYMNSYRSKATREALRVLQQGALTVAVLSFLRFWADDDLHYDWKLEVSVEEVLSACERACPLFQERLGQPMFLTRPWSSRVRLL